MVRVRGLWSRTLNDMNTVYSWCNFFFSRCDSRFLWTVQFSDRFTNLFFLGRVDCKGIAIFYFFSSYINLSVFSSISSKLVRYVTRCEYIDILSKTLEKEGKCSQKWLVSRDSRIATENDHLSFLPSTLFLADCLTYKFQLIY